MRVRIGDIVPISTVDWKGKCCSTIFIAGCPFRCTYCSNAPLIDATLAPEMELDEIKTKIKDASAFIDGVVFSGGEPTMSLLPLMEMARYAKSLGLKTAIHTNGYYPLVIVRLIDSGLLDAVMLDVKAPFDGEAYRKVVQTVSKESDMERLRLSAAICEQARGEGRIEYYEARTVCFAGMNDAPEELQAIIDAAPGVDAYVIVQGLADLCPNPSDFTELTVDQLLSLGSSLATDAPIWVRARAGEFRIGETPVLNLASGKKCCE